MLITPETALPAASQTCSSWDVSTELELARCKEDLRGVVVETIFSVSSRIAEVMSREGGSAAGLVSRCLGHGWGQGPAQPGHAVPTLFRESQFPWPLGQLVPSVLKWPILCKVPMGTWHTGGAEPSLASVSPSSQ